MSSNINFLDIEIKFLGKNEIYSIDFTAAIK